MLAKWHSQGSYPKLFHMIIPRSQKGKLVIVKAGKQRSGSKKELEMANVLGAKEPIPKRSMPHGPLNFRAWPFLCWFSDILIPIRNPIRTYTNHQLQCNSATLKYIYISDVATEYQSTWWIFTLLNQEFSWIILGCFRDPHLQPVTARWRWLQHKRTGGSSTRHVWLVQGHRDHIKSPHWCRSYMKIPTIDTYTMYIYIDITLYSVCSWTFINLHIYV